MKKNYLEGEPFKQVAISSEQTSVLNYDMMVISVGF